MPRVLFLPAARLEALEARAWYAARGDGLGEAFVAELDRQASRIAETPLQFPIVLGDARRVLMRRFPYALFFRLADGDAFVLACFHASRDPKSWQARFKD